jgi:hypothetical protein
LILSVLAVLIFSSCNKRLCKNIDCGHGICEYGICECEDGWKIDSDGKCLKQELCFGVDCGHGVCFSSDGTCQCDPNYELDSLGRCNRLWREKFLGTWLGSHINDNNDTIGPYSMTVTPVTSDIQKVQINNFCDYTCAFTGTGLVVNALVSFQTNLGFSVPTVPELQHRDNGITSMNRIVQSPSGSAKVVN